MFSLLSKQVSRFHFSDIVNDKLPLPIQLICGYTSAVFTDLATGDLLVERFIKNDKSIKSCDLITLFLECIVYSVMS